MSTINVDLPISSTLLAGTFTANLIDSSGYPPPDVVRAGDPFSIKCTLGLIGPLVPLVGGTWHIDVAFESAGPAPDYRTAPISVPLNGLVGANAYSASVTIPAGLNFPGGPPKIPANLRSQPYRVTAMLTYTGVDSKPGPLAASVDLGELTIFA